MIIDTPSSSFYQECQKGLTSLFRSIPFLTWQNHIRLEQANLSLKNKLSYLLLDGLVDWWTDLPFLHGGFSLHLQESRLYPKNQFYSHNCPWLNINLLCVFYPIPLHPQTLTLHPLIKPQERIPMHHCTPKQTPRQNLIPCTHHQESLTQPLLPHCPLLPHSLHTLFLSLLRLVFSHLLFSHFGRTHPPPPAHSSSLERAQHSLHLCSLPFLVFSCVTPQTHPHLLQVMF